MHIPGMQPCNFGVLRAVTTAYKCSSRHCVLMSCLADAPASKGMPVLAISSVAEASPTQDGTMVHLRPK